MESITPFTRKEKYINQIVGGGDTAPKTPQTREELFFAGILGEVVAPSPITRAEKYLAKIANKYSGEPPEPVTRIERFLARAAGMDVTIPTPITREEMFWAAYAGVEIEIEGVPPLTFKSNGANLSDYRIYGNTVNGENVGDLITEGEHAGEYRVPVTVEGQNLFDKNDFIPLNNMYVKQTNATLTIGAGNLGFVLPLNKGNYTVSCLLDRVNLSLFAGIFSTFPNEGDVALSVFKILYNDAKSSFSLANNGFLFMAYNNTAVTQYHTTEEILNALMIVRGSNAPTKYEPYHAPATTNLYLPEQIKMVGDEAEYIDFMEQKQHFVDGTSTDITLPEIAVTAETNTLTVGTEVQPSNVYIKYEGER